MLVHKINTTLRTTLVKRGDREGVIEREFQNYIAKSETMDLKQLKVIFQEDAFNLCNKLTQTGLGRHHAYIEELVA